MIKTGNNSTGTMAYETLHWDGGSLLLTTNSAGALDDIKIGGLANFVISSGTVKVAFNDRDFSGAIASSHTSAGAGTWYPPNPNRQLCSSAGTSDPITQPGPDGITDGINIFQGARAYDPVLGNWTAPDALGGVVGDPMTQQAYMWNRNNPLAYSDPSGYYILDNGTAQQQKAVADFAKALDKRAVAKLAEMPKNDPRRQGLEALHYDLQPGQGNWHIQFATADSPGNTKVSTNGSLDTYRIRITGVGVT
ncbi:MAG: RHS repeat-associated core domain-containing protein, partial [Acidiferrobacteraceae bacterium]